MWIAISNAIGSRQGVGGGPGPSPGYTPPLDTYTGATAAYSVRKLSSSYSGPCIEAYRVSDGATQDIGFDSAGLIDTAAIISFAGGGEVRVQTWYDQSGNGNNATNATPAGQPQIYDGSSVITTNGKPSLLHASDNNWLSRQTNITGTVTNFYVFIASDTNYSLHGGGTNLLATSGSSSSAGTTTGLYINSVQFTGSTRDDLYTAFGTSQVLSSDNVRVGDPLEGLVIFGYKATAASGFNFNDGNVQEVITWNSDQTSIRTGLEANLNSYFQVTNLPDYTSGLLYDYPGAAAAYSVRSLSNTAIKCMRVRRTVSPFDEQDIGFDSNGDLDIAAISTFGGSDPLTVSAWYDQSGQSRHATQAVAGSQPSIYDGAAVITENGKPIVTTGGIYTALQADIPGTSAKDLSIFSVSKFDGTYNHAGSIGNATFFAARNNSSGTVFENWQIAPSGFINGASFTGNQDNLYDNYFDTQTLFTGIDGQKGAATVYIATNPISNFWQSNDVQEWILFEDTDPSNRTGIESNINTYFSIY